MDNYFDISGLYSVSIHTNGTLFGYGYFDEKVFSAALCEKGKILKHITRYYYLDILHV